ncbi:alpha/beta hydrolase-fold protein [uncultured Prevotella sp.]|uniref:alpha/beta hydrolase-fold protein n=1 Tax=uncultured Prevotella sp. TaxID=159272 RepID=UPI002665E668|nr:alpha/beta hydrolase-fold protein [uncultured Prevotella sp.]
MTTIIQNENVNIGSIHCNVFATERPEVLLIQPSARHETKNDGINREVKVLATTATKGFAIVFFDTVEWAKALMPWQDEAVSRDEEVGRYASNTLEYIIESLMPWLHERFGKLPCIIGGYSLGGLFALWAARQSAAFCAVAAASPSLWIKGWADFADNRSLNAQLAYVSLGNREEYCRNQCMARIGDCVRHEHLTLTEQIGTTATTLEWNNGGHFGEEAERTAKAFAWCIENI